MKAIELLEKHPLSAKLVRDWFMERMIESVRGDETVPEDFKNFMLEQGIENDKLSIMIDGNPRILFDVFDENNVIVIIKYHENFGFTWAVEEADEQSFYKTRKEAELSAIEIAFDILENQLKSESDDSNVTADSEDN
jgi:small-conductance mechanosensitive channel